MRLELIIAGYLIVGTALFIYLSISYNRSRSNKTEGAMSLKTYAEILKEEKTVPASRFWSPEDYQEAKEAANRDPRGDNVRNLKNDDK